MSLYYRDLCIALVAAHLLGDFIVQTKKEVENKHNIWILFRHTVLIAMLSWLFCGLWSAWLIPAVIFVTHSLIDFCKSRLTKNGAIPFLLDQLAHLTVIALLAWWICTLDFPVQGYWLKILGPGYIKVLIMVSGIILTTRMGGFLIGFLLEPMEKELRDSIQQLNEAPPLFSGLKNGALLIGQLERALILLFYMTGEAGGIGFLMAAKSILRFSEVRNRLDKMTAEYIIIGTLMSFGYGTFIAIIIKWVLGKV
jgi:hypothetical protein